MKQTANLTGQGKKTCRKVPELPANPAASTSWSLWLVPLYIPQQGLIIMVKGERENKLCACSPKVKMVPRQLWGARGGVVNGHSWVPFSFLYHQCHSPYIRFC